MNEYQCLVQVFSLKFGNSEVLSEAFTPQLRLPPAISLALGI